MIVNGFRAGFGALLGLAGVLLVTRSQAEDLIVSANDGKFVRVDGRATFPQPAPPDSLAIIDATQFPPRIKATVEGIEHTVQGPPQAVAITPNGKLAIIGSPSRYDYAAKKESFDTFLQIVDLDASPPQLIGKVEIGAHPNGLAINPEGTLCCATARQRRRIFLERSRRYDLLGGSQGGLVRRVHDAIARAASALSHCSSQYGLRCLGELGRDQEGHDQKDRDEENCVSAQLKSRRIIRSDW